MKKILLVIFIVFLLPNQNYCVNLQIMNTRNSTLRRWIVMVIVSFAMMTGYVFWDIVSPLSTTLKAPLDEGGMAWTAAEYGF